MTFLIISFVAGVLTVLAPCILPLLSVVIGSSATGRSRATPYIVVSSLAVSIIAFTFLLKASTALITIPPYVWTYLSGGILFFFGLVLVFPKIWESIPGISKLASKSNELVGEGYQKKSIWGDVLIGAALGPVFSTCSPTYFVILASVLPASFLLGTAYLLSYTLGLSIILLLISLLGQRFAGKLTAFSDSRGVFKKIIGILFILLGIAIATGYEKKLEIKILDSGYFDVTKIENRLLQKVDMKKIEGEKQSYIEIVNPSGFVNTDGITIGELIGKKVILVDFMTYSCINCQRTFPYMNAWYEKYSDMGLEIIGIHTPEFDFERKIENVRAAMKKFGIKYPVVLDNDYATWNAFGNRYWPRKYLIDLEGNIVYDHIGEGGYVETEKKIQELLNARSEVVSIKAESRSDQPLSPETYFGSKRGNTQSKIFSPALSWSIMPEYATNTTAQAKMTFSYKASKVYFVAGADEPVNVMVYQDDKLIKTLTIKDEGLYTLIDDKDNASHTLKLIIDKSGLRAFTFTFG